MLLYTKPYFLDEVLSAVPALSSLCELHVVVEIPPEGWGANMLPERPANVSAGLHDLRDVLGDELPDAAWSGLSSAASLSAAVFDEKHTLSFAAVRSSLCLAQRIRTLAPDVIHLNGDSLRFAYCAPKLSGTALVLSVHDVMLHSGESGGWRSRLAIGRRILLRWASSIVVHNTRTRTGAVLSAARSKGVPIRCVLMGPYGIYRQLLGPSTALPSGSGGDVLFLGRLSPYKGLDSFVAAAQLASQEVRGVTFTIAGMPIRGYEPPQSQALRNGCDLEVASRHLSSREVAERVASCRFLVLPYKDATQSGVILTAYGLGKPVVATDVGGLGDYVDDGSTGRLVDPENPEALAAAIVDLCSNPPLISSLHAGVEQRTSNSLSWEHISARLLDVYGEAISGRSLTDSRDGP